MIISRPILRRMEKFQKKL